MKKQADLIDFCTYCNLYRFLGVYILTNAIVSDYFSQQALTKSRIYHER